MLYDLPTASTMPRNDPPAEQTIAIVLPVSSLEHYETVRYAVLRANAGYLRRLLRECAQAKERCAEDETLAHIARTDAAIEWIDHASATDRRFTQATEAIEETCAEWAIAADLPALDEARTDGSMRKTTGDGEVFWSAWDHYTAHDLTTPRVTEQTIEGWLKQLTEAWAKQQQT